MAGHGTGPTRHWTDRAPAMGRLAKRLAGGGFLALVAAGGWFVERIFSHWLDSPTGSGWEGRVMAWMVTVLTWWGEHPLPAVVLVLALYAAALIAWDLYQTQELREAQALPPPIQESVSEHRTDDAMIRVAVAGSNIHKIDVQIERRGKPHAVLTAATGPGAVATVEGGWLVWWHLAITNASMDHRVIDEARVFLRREHTHTPQPDLRLMWSTTEGPIDTTTIAYGESVLVPLVARAEREVAISGDPTRLRHFPLVPWIARVTDQRALVYQRDFTDVTGRAILAFRIRVESRDGRECLSNLFSFFVPAPGEPNSMTKLVEVLQDV